MEDLKKIIFKAFSSHKKDLMYFSKEMDTEPTIKCAKLSLNFKDSANKLFQKKSHDTKMHKQIFDLYCKSITHAPNNSEQLAFAYTKRSGLLMHIGKYEDCISDIDKALDILKTVSLVNIQLLCRKVECLKRLGSSKYSDTVGEAKSCVSKIDSACKNACDNLIKKVEDLSIEENVSISKKKNYVLSKSENLLNQVTIKFDKEYGRHLVAAKDYKPGDIIFVEKLYATDVNAEVSYIFCNYCLKLAWSGVPCENCNWAIFCSDQCKQKASTSYHDVECKIISHLRSIKEAPLELYYNISLRLLILGIREAGSIAELGKQLMAVEKSTDTCWKGFRMNEKFENKTIHSIFSLKSDGPSDYDCETIAQGALIILLGIIKHSKLIENFELKNIDDLLAHEDALFLGSLLLKFIIIKNNNMFAFSHKMEACEKSKSLELCTMQSCCARASCLAPLASLINHSCFPNASKCFTEDQKIVVYALQPIKQNSQIFISYAVYFYNTLIAKRKSFLEKYYFECKCEACEKFWLPLHIADPNELKSLNYTLSKIESKVSVKCINVIKALDSKSNDIDKGAIKILSQSLVKSLRFEQPTILTSSLMEALDCALEFLYGLKTPLFGQCTAV